MKKKYYILLGIGHSSLGYRKYDYMTLSARDCVRLDSSSILVDEIQITFNEVSVEKVSLEPFDETFFEV